MKKSEQSILWFKEVSKKEVALVGGKNASLGEMLSNLSAQGINVPDGFALTAKAYWRFLEESGLGAHLEKIFGDFKGGNISALQKTGLLARRLIMKAEFPDGLKSEILTAYGKLSDNYLSKGTEVAVRSSGVAEDAPTASFAGQFESFLNVSGEKQLLSAIKKCLASAFGDRVISYRQEKGINQLKFALSIGVQKMVRSDLGSSGVMFTLDTESGFDKVVLINSIFGVGEMIVKGRIIPDEFYVFKPALKKGYRSIILKNLGEKDKKYVFAKKGGLRRVALPTEKRLGFSLSDDDILKLARWGCRIEEYYQWPQDIEWAKDGRTGELFIVQSRPETVHSAEKQNFYRQYRIKTKGKPLLTGIAVGEKIGAGKVRIIPKAARIFEFKRGEVLVTKMTDPDWVPAMRIASAIVTEQGGRTCHAAIVGRELGIPAVVGVAGALKTLKTGQLVTVDCAQGSEGRVYAGRLSFQVKTYNLKNLKRGKVKIMVNIGAPEIAFKTSFLPNDGVGLAREEFIIAEKIRVHPLALYHFQRLKAQTDQPKVKAIVRQIEKLTIEHEDKRQYFIKELAEGVAQIAASFWPNEVIVRFSDFKSNEYQNLIGGRLFEESEANPMLGFRGACRYLDKKFRPAFKMECEAIKRAREVFGLKNISVMVPFCRTVEEGAAVIKLIGRFGLKRKPAGPKIYVMAEIPSNVILADEFLKIFDGMSIGSNDLTQLTLGLDRDNAKIAYVGNEENKAVKEMIKRVIKACRRRKKYCGICGQAPSDLPGFAKFLVEQGIGSISLSPDTVIKTILELRKPRKKDRLLKNEKNKKSKRLYLD
jgi:pyruvate,water dikinase